MGKIKVIGLDTAVVIYLLEQHPKYFQKVRTLFDDIEHGKLQAVFSSIGLIELLVGPKRHNRSDLVIKYQTYLAAYDDLAIVDLLPQIILEASSLRAKYNIATPDAIHLATAIAFEVDTFITNDRDLKKVKEVNVTLL